MFRPIEVEITPDPDFRPIEVAAETAAAPVADQPKKPTTGKKES